MLWFQICFAKTHFLFQNTSTWTCLKGFFLLIHTSSCRHHESNEQSENIIIFHNNCLDHARKFCYQIELTLLSRRLGNVWKYTSLRYLSYSMTRQGHIIVIPISHFLWMKERNSESRKCSGHAHAALSELYEISLLGQGVTRDTSKCMSSQCVPETRELTSGRGEKYTPLDIWLLVSKQ